MIILFLIENNCSDDEFAIFMYALISCSKYAAVKFVGYDTCGIRKEPMSKRR